MKSVLICFCMLFMGQMTLAQENLQFEKTTHDFGQVNETGGPITYSFNFVNKGDTPISITGVKASCGCTTPAWTREEILPNDSGFVTAQYNPYNRPGNFKKSLRVSYRMGDEVKQEVLYIEGNVKPKPKTIEDELPTRLGDLRLKYKSLNVGKITTERAAIQTFDVHNAGDSAWAWIPEKSLLPTHVQVSFEPTSLEPQQTGKIVLTYDPNESGDFGFRSDNIKLYTTESEQPEKELSVIATVEEYFPPMTEEELEKAPRLSFDKNQHDFGSLKQGNIVSTTFILTNAGQQDLLIRQVKANCGCTIPKLKKDKIAPGKSVELEVKFDTAERRGRQYKTVTVFSNDPTAPTQTLSLKAEISD